MLNTAGKIIKQPANRRTGNSRKRGLDRIKGAA